ncbi:MAG: ribose-5-phosphate isomerase A, partial [Arsenophonus sp. NC-QC1-MAG3]
ALTGEKVIAAMAKQFIVIADKSKQVGVQKCKSHLIKSPLLIKI